MALDTAGAVWVGTTTQIRKLDAATGLPTVSFNAPGGNGSYFGLQVLPAGLTLAGVVIPAGSLLVEDGQPQPDKVYALNPANGAILASLTLPNTMNVISGVFDPNRNSFFLLNYSPSANSEVIETRTNDGGVLNRYPLPTTVDRGGLALDPATGELWVASNRSNVLYLMNRATGAIVRTVPLGLQGVGNEITGIGFDAAGKLWAASHNGYVYRGLSVDAAPAAVPLPALSSIVAAALDGTPANAGAPSADVGQAITLVGSNFTRFTQVIFPTRDENGLSGVAAALPTAVSADGTRLQVTVPDLAATGPVTVNGFPDVRVM
jgi:outer membrane protein assembly factor BamB